MRVSLRVPFIILSNIITLQYESIAAVTGILPSLKEAEAAVEDNSVSSSSSNIPEHKPNRLSLKLPSTKLKSESVTKSIVKIISTSTVFGRGNKSIGSNMGAEDERKIEIKAITEKEQSGAACVEQPVTSSTRKLENIKVCDNSYHKTDRRKRPSKITKKIRKRSKSAVALSSSSSSLSDAQRSKRHRTPSKRYSPSAGIYTSLKNNCHAK